VRPREVLGASRRPPHADTPDYNGYPGPGISTMFAEMGGAIVPVMASQIIRIEPPHQPPQLIGRGATRMMNSPSRTLVKTTKPSSKKG